MTIQQAIQKAIEGGWGNDHSEQAKRMGTNHWYEAYILLDPLFWQSLGKAMEWDKSQIAYKCLICDAGNATYWFTHQFCSQCGRKTQPFTLRGKEWLAKWHELIDHLAEGKSIESYFETL